MPAREYLACTVLGLLSIHPVLASPEPDIEVFWSFPELLEAKLPPAGRNAVEKEVTVIYREIGIAVRFPGAARPEGESSAPAFFILLITRSGTGFGLDGRAMGAILEKDPEQHTVFVFLPAILRSLRHTLAQNETMIHDVRKGKVFARALGRVVAHEIAHAIDRDLPHGPKDSLMSEHLTPRMLQQHRLSFDETTAARLRERVPHLGRKSPPEPCPEARERMVRITPGSVMKERIFISPPYRLPVKGSTS